MNDKSEHATYHTNVRFDERTRESVPERLHATAREWGRLARSLVSVNHLALDKTDLKNGVDTLKTSQRPCLLWTGGKRIKWNRSRYDPRRLLYEMARGVLGPADYLIPVCERATECVEPEHMRVDTKLVCFGDHIGEQALNRDRDRVARDERARSAESVVHEARRLVADALSELDAMPSPPKRQRLFVLSTTTHESP